MSEKEKMLNGEYYKPMEDKQLSSDRDRVKELCRKYNSLAYTDIKNRNKIIKQILGKTGKTLLIEPNFFCDYGYNIEVGENFYMNHNCVVLDCAKVTFGDNVFIGPNCSFYTPIHPLKAKERNSGIEKALPIKVGNNVWFGGNVVVLPNVKIGDNSVIGAGSVVTKDIPANVVAVGNPCKVIKKIDN